MQTLWLFEKREQPLSYHVHSLFLTLQGEGVHTGRVAVFCRFTGCNLWSGREQDRATATCRFCDTDFVGSNQFESAYALGDAIEACWGDTCERRFVVFTGGEPTLQLDAALLKDVRDRGFIIAIETNGTLLTPLGIDWICVSPKAGTTLVQKFGNELKLVVPQDGVDPSSFLDMDFKHFSLSPMDGPDVAANTQAAIDYCLHHPRWRLNLQTHKFTGIR